MPSLHIERSAAVPRVKPELMSTRDQPAVVEMFDVIRHPEDTPRPWTEYHSLENYFNSSLKFGFYFHEAKAAWEFAYDEERVKEALASPDNQFSQAYLKILRRIGLVFRSSYKLFDGWHIEPESLAVFVGKLGACNDWIKHTGVVPDKLLTEEDYYALRHEQFGYEPVSVESCQQYVQSLLVQIEALSCRRTAGIKDFHAVRKQVRHLMNAIQIPACFEPGQPLHSLFLEHHRLSQKMGEIHDQAVAQTLGREQEYARIQIRLPDEIRFELEKVCLRHSWVR